MSRWGFLASRRWAFFFVAVLLLTWLAWQLGQWQFHRLEDRRDRNAIIQRNEELPPAPVADLLAVGRQPADADQWRVVEATGRYAPEDTVVVRYRTRDGAPGVNAVVPLVLDDGTALLVDRGWWPTANRGEVPDDLPEPPPGEVTVTGWVRQDATGDSAQVTEQRTRAISSAEIGEALDREVLGGFVALSEETPPPAEALQPTELPELDEGPHFFYGLQWWFFGVLAVFGFLYLLVDEWRDRRKGSSSESAPTPSAPPSTPPSTDEGSEKYWVR